MDIVELIRQSHPTDVAGVLALVVLFYARKDALSHRREWKEVSERCERHEATLIDLVKENINALSENTATSRTVLEATRELRVEVTELRKSNGRH
jgi:hypothetical protein